MSDENDTPTEDFVAAEAESTEESAPAKKSAGGLKFLTFLMLVAAVGLFVFPFVWGLDDPAKISPDPSVLNDWLWWLGDLHVLILHIPIGVFIWAFTLECVGLLTWRKFKPHLGGTLFFASITSIVAVVFGYFYFLRGEYGDAELKWDLEGNRMGMHMWLSILFSFFVILSFISKMWSRHNDKGSPFYPFFMLLAAASMGLGAHMGGQLVHPAKDIEGDFQKLIAGEPLSLAEDEIVKLPAVTDIPAGERLVYAQIVKPILQGKCWECHAHADLNPLGKKKIKGKLVMTSVADLLKGGKGGEDFPTLIPGDSENSEMIIRPNLDVDDDEFMPTSKEDEPHMHLTDGEKKILAWWIDNTPLIDEASDKPLAAVEGHEAILAEVAAFEPVRDTEVIPEGETEVKEEEKVEKVEVKVTRREEIEAAKAGIDAIMPGALTFSSKDSEELFFTSVSKGKKFSDADLAQLAPVALSIVDLDLKKSSVTDKGMESVAEMLNLKRLMLNETQVTDAGLQTLAVLPNLESLSLFGTKVSDQGAAKLAQIATLKSVYLSDTQVTQKGVDQLAEKLPAAKIEFTAPQPPKAPELSAAEMAEKEAKRESAMAKQKAMQEKKRKAKEAAAKEKAAKEKAEKEKAEKLKSELVPTPAEEPIEKKPEEKAEEKAEKKPEATQPVEPVKPVETKKKEAQPEAAPKEEKAARTAPADKTVEEKKLAEEEPDSMPEKKEAPKGDPAPKKDEAPEKAAELKPAPAKKEVPEEAPQKAPAPAEEPQKKQEAKPKKEETPKLTPAPEKAKPTPAPKKAESKPAVTPEENTPTEKAVEKSTEKPTEKPAPKKEAAPAEPNEAPQELSPEERARKAIERLREAAEGNAADQKN